MKSGEHYDAHYWRFNMPEELPIYPFCSESVLRREPRRTDWMRHPFLILCGLSSGSLRYIFSNRKIVLQEQEVILIPPGTPYFFESHSTGGCYSKQVLEL
ncbi:MAG: AraC family ligand binding domain-containing protein, partial [Lentisphaeria bacterium]|nr:AraC family ligand binding domain-containing protein [Lentisphaeria bacterium]